MSELRRLSLAKAEAIVRKLYPKERVISVKRIDEGMINPLFEVECGKRDVMVRVCPEEHEHYKPDKEKYVHDLILDKSKVPVPKIILLEKSKSIIPSVYLLMTKMHGIKFSECIAGRAKRISLKSKKRLNYQIGNYLGQIHSIKFKRFGWLTGKGLQKNYSNWKEFFNSMINAELDKLEKPAKLESIKGFRRQRFVKLLPAIRGYLSANQDLLDIKARPCLCHNDYHFANILIKKNKEWEVSAVLDLEWAYAGHNECDLVKSESYFGWKYKYNEYARPFFRGYNKHIKLTKEYKKRRKLYLLLHNLGWLNFHYNHSKGYSKQHRWVGEDLKRIFETINWCLSAKR